MMLSEKIINKKCKVAVIGLGYVGLSLAVDVAKSGFYVVGFDEDQSRIDKLNLTENYISSVNDEDFRTVLDSGFLVASSDYSLLEECDIQILCVPTPLNLNKQPDLSYIESAASTVAEHLRKDTLVILQSTTYPGTTNDIIKPILESSSMICGQDFYLAFSPERVDPGNTMFNTKNTPRVVGGISPKCSDMAVLFYKKSINCPTHRVSSTQAAEMSKLLENSYRNVNIGLINEFAILSRPMGIDIWEVIEAAKTKPFGFFPFYPGPGVGGHCIPLDPFYYAWKVREYDKRATIIEASGNILDNMPQYVMCRIMEEMNARNLLVNGAKVLMIGVAYKADINDARESPALKLLDLLIKNGAVVGYHDPMIPEFLYNGIQYVSSELSLEVLHESELTIIMTAHRNIDYERIRCEASLIFDTRNVYGISNANIVRL